MAKNPDLKPGTFVLNIVRGTLIGAVETVPGVSGGTVALVVGVYERLIGSAAAAITGLREIAAGTLKGDKNLRRTGANRFKKLPWGLLVAILLGMFAALIVMSNVMSMLVAREPILMSATFFGMVLASLYVPYKMTGKWRATDYLLCLLAAAVIYFIVSLPPSDTDLSNPSPIIIVFAAAIAVSALLLPGLSGSFLLLTFGLYQTTLGAVKDFDFAYLGWFALGALLGMATVVKGLEWLLTHHHHITLVVLTGVMVGALHAIWPWKSPQNDLLPVGTQAGMAALWAVIGFAIVALVIVAEKLWSGKKAKQHG